MSGITMDISMALVAIDSALHLTADHQAFLSDVANYGQKVVQERIKTTKTDPMNMGWTPWSESRAEQRDRRGNASQGLLWDSGSLLNSIQTRIDGATAFIETNSGYAGFLQDGTKNMAARAFMGWSDQDIAHIEGMFAARFGGV